MGVYMSGYTFGQISMEHLQEAIEKANLTFLLKVHPLMPNHGIDSSLQVEIKQMENGLYLDTEFEIKDKELMELSKFIATGILKFKFSETGMTFLCNYFINGTMPIELLERERRFYDHKMELEEYKNKNTDTVISELFSALTNSGLYESMDNEGEIYYFALVSKR
jgi:hypothetical protein